MDENAYVLQLEATSVFDSTPSAIRDDLEKQLAMGLVTPEEYRLQLSHPDDQAELSLQSAAAADIERVIGVLEDGEYESPVPIQDLVNGVQKVSLAALLIKQYDEYKDGSLADVELNFLNWITEARNILSIGEEPAPTQTPSEATPGLGTPPVDPMTGMPQMPQQPMGPMGPSGGMPPGAGMPMAPGPMQIPVPESAGMGGRTNRK